MSDEELITVERLLARLAATLSARSGCHVSLARLIHAGPDPDDTVLDRFLAEEFHPLTRLLAEADLDFIAKLAEVLQRYRTVQEAILAAHTPEDRVRVGLAEEVTQ